MTRRAPAELKRERLEVRALERLLERGRWPSGLELTGCDRDVIGRNLERLVARLELLA